MAKVNRKVMDAYQFTLILTGIKDLTPDVTDAQLEELALATDAVQRALDGKTVRKVIIRAPKLVNLVPN